MVSETRRYRQRHFTIFRALAHLASWHIPVLPLTALHPHPFSSNSLASHISLFLPWAFCNCCSITCKHCSLYLLPADFFLQDLLQIPSPHLFSWVLPDYLSHLASTYCPYCIIFLICFSYRSHHFLNIYTFVVCIPHQNVSLKRHGLCLSYSLGYPQNLTQGLAHTENSINSD